jgi:hypothetical protein
MALQYPVLSRHHRKDIWQALEGHCQELSETCRKWKCTGVGYIWKEDGIDSCKKWKEVEGITLKA